MGDPEAAEPRIRPDGRDTCRADGLVGGGRG